MSTVKLESADVEQLYRDLQRLKDKLAELQILSIREQDSAVELYEATTQVSQMVNNLQSAVTKHQNVHFT